jgi:hypothetical protein
VLRSLADASGKGRAGRTLETPEGGS